jgi:hypothetical protein
MLKGYPIGPFLQTTPVAESSVTHHHIQSDNCGEIATLPLSCSPHAHTEFSGEVDRYRLNRAS